MPTCAGTHGAVLRKMPVNQILPEPNIPAKTMKVPNIFYSNGQQDKCFLDVLNILDARLL